MSDAAIEVTGLGKQYRLGQREPYKTLRDALARGTSAPFRYVRSALGRGYRSPARPKSEPFWALKDVSFEVKQGEAVGIIGRNGSGKSTLLKILSRITNPSEGQVRIRGRVGSLLEVGTGFHPELTGRENIHLNGAILGMRRTEIDRKFDEIVAFAEVDRFLDTPVKRYSSGMYVRLAFAVAAHLDPEILLVDEVLAVGDADFQKKCLGRMSGIASEGRTVLFISHNLGAVRQLCPRCLLLDGGRAIQEGPAEDVIAGYMNTLIHVSSEFSQPIDDEKPICLRRVILLDADSKQNATIDYRREFSLAIDYQVNRPIAGCIVWAAIRSGEDIQVLVSADYDSEPSLLAHREPGTYRAVVRFPSRWLNAGIYPVVVGIAGQSPVTSYDRVEAVTLNIVDPTSYQLSEAADRPGLLKPVLAWETRRTGSKGSLE
jgi:lipopolysaccharide transport system ATP-binding protein